MNFTLLSELTILRCNARTQRQPHVHSNAALCVIQATSTATLHITHVTSNVTNNVTWSLHFDMFQLWRDITYWSELMWRYIRNIQLSTWREVWRSAYRQTRSDTLLTHQAHIRSVILPLYDFWGSIWMIFCGAFSKKYCRSYAKHSSPVISRKNLGLLKIPR